MSRTYRNIEILKHKSFRDFRNNHSIRIAEYSARDEIEEEGFKCHNRLKYRSNPTSDAIPKLHDDIYLAAIDELPKDKYMELFD